MIFKGAFFSMNNYNSIASYYRFLVRIVFGQSIDEAQAVFINQLPNNGRLLFIGGGNGNVLKLIYRLKPQLEIDFIDQSEKMIESAKKFCPHDLVNFIVGNEESIPNRKYDAIITFFFLDLFSTEKRDKIMKTLENLLKVKGIWLVADFKQPITTYHKLIEKVMFLFLKITTKIESDSIENYSEAFEKTDLNKLTTETFYNNFIYSTVYQKAT